MDLLRRFELLGRQKIVLAEGVAMLRQAALDLQSARRSAINWGNVAIFANLVIIPLNAIVNSFEMKGAKGIYQELVKQVYEKFAASGTRSDGKVMSTLSILKKVLRAELSSRSLGEFIPGVNILVGFAEDSYTAWQTAQTVSAGSIEMNNLMDALDRKLNEAIRQLTYISQAHAQAFDDGLGKMRTA